MATEQKEAVTGSRPLKALLRQPEIEEVDEEDTSPGSDQSDTTITAGTDTPRVTEGESSESGVEDLKSTSPSSHKHNHISPKIKQLTRSEALCDECASPPLDPLQSTASTCSTDSSSSGIGTKSLTSGSGSGGSFRGRLEKDGSQSSEAGTSSSLSRDSSVDTPYKDSTGIDLEDFIKRTLNKTPKDRSMMIKLEVDLIKFIREPKHHYLKFPQMSSYDRMLVHRIAAFFGLDHNVDQTGKCVIVNKTQSTRIPDFSFQDHIINNGSESKPKMLLKRSVGGSFDELQTRNLQKPSLDSTRAAKSLEERQQHYDEIRSKIFTSEEGCEGQPIVYSQEESANMVKKMQRPHSLGSSKDEHTWSGLDPSGYAAEPSGRIRNMPVPKANSFGGMGTFVLSHMKSPKIGGSLSKAGSLPGQGQKVYWVASDLSSIPPGSVVINPQTGQPYMNPDGSQYRYAPGQPLPQPNTTYPPSPQPQVYQVQPEWTQQVSQDSQSSQELCGQMSVMRITPQSSLEGGCGGGDSLPQPAQQQASVVIGQGVQGAPHTFQQQPLQPQQQQGVYYPGTPTIPGQGSVRYMTPMTYNVPHTGGVAQPGYMPPQCMPAADGQTQHFPSQQYCQQYIQGYPNGQMYQMTSQGQVVGGQGQSCEVSYQQCGYSATSPVEVQTGAMPVGQNYIAYSQQQTIGAPSQSQMYYVQTPNTNQPQVQGYTFSGQQGATTYQTNTPPSQNSSVNPNVQLNTISAQPVSMNTVNMAQPQQPPGVGGPGQPLGAASVAPTQPNTQYISYPSSHHTMVHMPQQFPQSFSNSVRPNPVTPQVVPLQMQGAATQPSHAFHPTMFRPNMQMPMQLHQHQQQLQQQQPAVVTKSPHPPAQHSHVTVSAKSVSYENSPVTGKVENGSGENSDIVPGVGTEAQGATTSIIRTQAPNQGDVRPQYPQPQYRPQVQPVQFSHQQSQSVSKSPTAPKPQRIKKSRSRDSQQSQKSAESGSTVTTNILEVCDLPLHLKRDSIDKLLQELLTAGAKLQYVSAELESNPGDFNSNNQTISQDTRVFAVFPDKHTAAHVLQTHTSSSYKLQPADNIVSLA